MQLPCLLVSLFFSSFCVLWAHSLTLAIQFFTLLDLKKHSSDTPTTAEPLIQQIEEITLALQSAFTSVDAPVVDVDFGADNLPVSESSVVIATPDSARSNALDSMSSLTLYRQFSSPSTAPSTPEASNCSTHSNKWRPSRSGEHFNSFILRAL